MKENRDILRIRKKTVIKTDFVSRKNELVLLVTRLYHISDIISMYYLGKAVK